MYEANARVGARQAASATRLGSNLDSVRLHNLSTVLDLVHRCRSLSRSELTAKTGLNRSTIAALVGELVGLGLVTEGGSRPNNQVGRPSSIVSASQETVALAVNPEIDAITIGLVSLGGIVHKRIRYETTTEPTVTEAVNITAAILEGVRTGLGPNQRVAGIGVAVPGLVRSQDGVVRLAPHLGWAEQPIAELLTEATGLPTFAANDATLGALAERTFGAGIDVAHVVYLNGGASGIGGGVISGGAPLAGVGGYAGEFGHIRVRSNGAPDTAGLHGTLESEVKRSSLLDVLGLETADVDELEAALLTSQSPAVRKEVNRQLDFLGSALGSVINILNPQLVILGGFLGSLYAMNTQRLEDAVSREAMPSMWSDVRISRPALGADILMVGAAQLAFADLIADPAGFQFPSNEGSTS